MTTGRGTGQVANEEIEWPVWVAPPSSAAAETTGYGGIARYVVPKVLEEYLPHAFPRGIRARLARRATSRAQLDRLIVEQLWLLFAEHRIPYTAPPWHPAEGQRIRDPEWLWRWDASGTCIDLALLFAAACLNEELDVSLVMIRNAALGHVGVAVKLGSEPAAGRSLPGVDWPGAPGVGRIWDPEYCVEDPQLLFLDPTTGTAGSELEGLAASSTELTGLLAGGTFSDLHLVDVAIRHRLGDTPLPSPTRRGALRSRLPRPSAATYTFPSHQEVRAAFHRRTTNTVVLRGPQGVGKSTLAREFAYSADHGYGWFLAGTTRRAYQASMAEHEQAESGLRFGVLESTDVAEVARRAEDRLVETPGDWVVVVDNADRGPTELGTLPRPRDGQLLVITSTAPRDVWAAYEPIEVGPLTATDLTQADTDPRIAHIVAGSPLLLNAFTTLTQMHPEVFDQLPTSSAIDVETGAALFWTLLRQWLPEEIDLAERLALLPPDAIERNLANGLGPGSIDRLAQAGLLTPLGADDLSMHRILGRAVRAWSRTNGSSALAATDVLRTEQVRQALAGSGDTDVTAALSEALSDSQDGVTLARLAALQELHDGLHASLATFQRAERALPRGMTDPESGDARADCLHARAREVNQRRKDRLTLRSIREAEGWLREAIDLRNQDDIVQIARHEALRALLRQRSVSFMKRRRSNRTVFGVLLRRRSSASPRTASPKRAAVYHDVALALDESWRLRRTALGDAHPLVDRALFNRAGVRINLAQEERDAATAHLKTAEGVYRTTLRFRESFYPRVSPLTAASLAGVATWGYYAVALGVTEDVEKTLAEALHMASRSLEVRRLLRVSDDIVKSASILAKLGLLQAHLGGGVPGDITVEALAELAAMNTLAEEP